MSCIKDIESLERQLLPKDQISFFDAIGFADQEIRHSKLLSFLLNPNNNHLLADSFIKEILLNVATNNPKAIKRDEAMRYITSDFDDAKVVTEWHHIDIYLESKQNKIIVAIENKIKAREHNSQLNTYQERVNNRIEELKKSGQNGFKSILLFLTPNEAAPSNNAWIPISYELIVDSLKSARDARSIPADSDASRLITEYIRLIENEIIMNSELKDALLEIYQKHKVIFDLVIDAKDEEDDGSFEEEIRDELIKTLTHATIPMQKTSSHRWQKGYMKGYGFTSEKWINDLPDELDSKWWKYKKPVTWFIKFYYENEAIKKIEAWLDFKGDWVVKDERRVNFIETMREKYQPKHKKAGKPSKGGIILGTIENIGEQRTARDISQQLAGFIQGERFETIERDIFNFFEIK